MKSKEEILNYLQRNKDLLHKKFHIIKIGLFGSIARDEQNNESDIDLIVEFERNTPNLYDLKQELKYFLKQQLKVDKIDICRERYIKPMFKQSVLRETYYV
jgi:predicted nucleotidyltransferase